MYHVRFVSLTTGKFFEVLLRWKSYKNLKHLEEMGDVQIFYKRKWGKWNELQNFKKR